MTPLYAGKVANVLSRVNDDGPGPSPQNRADAIEAISRAIAVRAKRKTRARVGSAFALVAAASVVGVFAFRHPHRNVQTASAPENHITVIAHPAGSAAVVVNNAPETELRDGKSLPTGAHVVAREGGVTLALSTGTKLAMEANSDLSVVDEGATQRFALSSGALRADVAKLRENERFIIGTPDAEVEVHGTSFRVSLESPTSPCAAKTRTRVTVFEGVVTVRAGGQESAVPAGSSWPSGCSNESPASFPPVPPPTRITEARRLENKNKTISPIEQSVAASHASTLAVQNDLFAKATDTKNHGRALEAVAIYQQLIEQYPHGPLSESALVESMKLLKDSDRAAATDMARRYLREYPNGFARADAEAIVAP